jgi:Serine incorporator (Serinc)
MPSTLASSVSSGRKRSVLLLVMAIGLAISFQYAASVAGFQPANPYLYNSWMDGCIDNRAKSIDLTKACIGNNGVYRPMFAATVFFLLAAVAAFCKPTANREAWPAKFVLYLFGVAALFFIPNTPLFNPIYLNIARSKTKTILRIRKLNAPTFFNA